MLHNNIHVTMFFDSQGAPSNASACVITTFKSMEKVAMIAEIRVTLPPKKRVIRQSPLLTREVGSAQNTSDHPATSVPTVPPED
ncbi:MAG: hypothetical protein ACXACI_08380 [Candidatus Hodarchaeales archaeon]|jgi:hypothetical protein